MSKKPEAKAEKSKLIAHVSSLIDPFRNLFKTKHTASLGSKSKTKNFNTESGIVQERSNSTNSTADAFVYKSFAEQNYSSLNDIKSSQLCEDPILQKYDEVKDKSLKKQNASRVHKNEEVEAIGSVQFAITPITSEDEVKLNNIDTDKTLNIQSEYKIATLFDDRSIKSEPVDAYDDESKTLYASLKNKSNNSDRLLNGHVNHQNVTCLENRNIKDKETDTVNYKLESESDEDIIERDPVKTSKHKERHSEYPSRKSDQKAANKTISQDATFPADIEKQNLYIEIEKIIADIEIATRIAKLKVDREITCILGDIFGPDENFFYSISNPAIKSQELKTEARYKIFMFENFSKDVFREECLQMKTWIQGPEFNSSDPKKRQKVIHYLKLYGRKKYRRTNLHDAVINENLEKTLCILETHKWFHKDLFEINAEDSSNPKKTALDWACEIRNVLLIDYLKENLATCAVHITPINTPGT